MQARSLLRLFIGLGALALLLFLFTWPILFRDNVVDVMDGLVDVMGGRELGADLKVAERLRKGDLLRRRGKTHGRTVLMYAAWVGDMELARDALAEGVDPNACDRENLSALSYAVRAKREGITRLLISNGASWRSNCDARTSPLLEACASGDLASLKLLLDHGADPNAPVSAQSQKSTIEYVQLWRRDLTSRKHNLSMEERRELREYEEILKLLERDH